MKHNVYCTECLKPCGETESGDGDGIRRWIRYVSDCCRETTCTRREALEEYAWMRNEREESRKRKEKILALVDSLAADIKALRPKEDPLHKAMEQMLVLANDPYNYLNGRQ